MSMRELIYILWRIYKAADINRLKLRKKNPTTQTINFKKFVSEIFIDDRADIPVFGLD